MIISMCGASKTQVPYQFIFSSGMQKQFLIKKYSPPLSIEKNRVGIFKYACTFVCITMYYSNIFDHQHYIYGIFHAIFLIQKYRIYHNAQVIYDYFEIKVKTGFDPVKCTYN